MASYAQNTELLFEMSSPRIRQLNPTDRKLRGDLVKLRQRGINFTAKLIHTQSQKQLQQFKIQPALNIEQKMDETGRVTFTRKRHRQNVQTESVHFMKTVHEQVHEMEL
ncbi:Hypothetical_protein [Hexamita inflata]|uniref:Hypothetical_protein n=1 Tax=Hexamita inflata TaxID=28002 RepID=A0ABP1IKU4_9EUKA